MLFRSETREELVGLVANEGYFKGRPKIDRIILRAVHDEKKLLELFNDSQLTAATGLDNQTGSIDNSASVREYDITLNGQVSVFFKTTQGDLTDVKVRQALVRAINKADTLQSLGYPVASSKTPFLPNHVGYNKDFAQPGFDSNEANRLLDEAGWKKNDKDYKFSRLLCRARYYPGTPRGVTRMWFNMYGATPGSVEGQRSRRDGLARNAVTGYQAMFRTGSHQSATRGWLKPTLMTDSLTRKELMGQVMGQGFLPDSHCPTGAPRESIVKITPAEPGGVDGQRLWRPASLGYRPGYENEAVRRFLKGDFIKKG